jgi:hypothetical protein
MTPASRRAFSRGLLRPLLPSMATVMSPWPLIQRTKAFRSESVVRHPFVVTGAPESFTVAQTNPLESGSIPMASLNPIVSSLKKLTVPFRHPCNEPLLLLGAGMCFIRPERSLWRWQSPASRLLQRQLTPLSNNATRGSVAVPIPTSQREPSTYAHVVPLPLPLIATTMLLPLHLSYKLTASLSLRPLVHSPEGGASLEVGAATQLIVDFLREAYRRTRKDAAPGADGVTAAEYAMNLEENLQNLYERMRGGRYEAPPVRRAWLDKEDGSKRPIGVPQFEDKIVQRAVSMLLGAIYENDFYDFSYGFREGHSPHQAIGTLREWCRKLNIGWIVDADVSGFFDNLDRGLLREIIERRVNDGGVLR